MASEQHRLKTPSVKFSHNDAALTTGPQGTQGPKPGYTPEKRGEVAKWENGVTGYRKWSKIWANNDHFEISPF